MKKRSFSIKYRVLIWVFALLFPSVLLLGCITVLQVDKTYTQLETSEATNLQLIVSQIERETKDVESYLYDMALENRVFRSMADQRDQVQLYASAYEVLQSSDSLFQANDGLSFLLLYSEKGDYYAVRDDGLHGLELTQQVELRQAVHRRFQRYFLEGNSQHRQWFPVEIGQRWFLCRMVYYQGMYCAALFDLLPLVEQLSQQLREDGVLFFRDQDILLTPAPADLLPEDWAQSTVRAPGGRNYMLLTEPLYGIQLSYLFSYSGIFGLMGVSMTLVILIAAAVLVAVPVFYIQLNRDFLRPLDNLVDAMRSIRDGSMDTLPEQERTCKEFQEVHHTFRQMLDQIRNLKIEHYEKEIETQRAELSFLQAQIRPHFYLNCLKVLYALAEQGQYAKIKTCILLVSKHLRYAFQVHTDTVSMREELSLCENYVRLYGAMGNAEPQLFLDVEPPLLDVPIPPISLLSMVENSVRINLAPDRELQIRIRAKRMQTEDGPVLCLTVQDNGTGFTQEELERFNGVAWLRQTTTHVGLQNAVRRFQILYGDGFSIAFLNRDGAVLELYLPLEDHTGEETEHAEAADRG